MTKEEINLGFKSLFGKDPGQASQLITKMGFDAGVEFAQSKLYSEDDMKTAFNEGCIQGFHEARGNEESDFDGWFDTIKKK